MSELIVEMEMPKNCPECHFSTACSFCEGYDDICVLAPKDAEYEWNFSDGVKPTERPTWCPIKGVLPDKHGRIIDEAVFCENVVKYSHQSIKTIGKALDATPTIIDMTPIVAERSET